MKTLSKPFTWLAMPVVLLLALAVVGCSTGGQTPPPNPVGQEQGSSGGFGLQSSQPPPSSGPSSVPPSGPSASRPVFYDFPDIPIPHELDLQADDSYVFQAGSLKTGLLTFRGRVDVSSLINFFQTAMLRENWKSKGGFRYKRSVLIFEKADKVCIINLYEKTFYTYAEIYVAPSGGQI